MDDTISRQEAIKAIEAYFGDLPIKGHYDMLQLIKQLPSAQPDLSGYSDKLWKAAYERGKAEAEQSGILWEKLERYAEFFCADVPYTEFVREAKQFFLDAERSEE